MKLHLNSFNLDGNSYDNCFLIPKLQEKYTKKNNYFL